MKKFVVKTLVFLGIGAFALFTAHTMAQFGTTAGADFAGQAGVSSDKSLLDVVKGFINFVLGLLSLIALAMALYGGFQMVTAAGDDGKYKGGFKVLKQAAIGLVVVGLSWIIVSTIFAVIGSAREGDAISVDTAASTGK